jgi:hypothetical protein
MSTRKNVAYNTGDFDKQQPSHTQAVNLQLIVIVTLITIILANISVPYIRVIVNDYPSQHPQIFVLEMLVFAITLAFTMLMIAMFRDASCNATNRMIIYGFIMGCLLHVFQQYSGVYQYLYSLKTPPMTEMYISVTSVLMITLIVWFFYFLSISLCARNQPYDFLDQRKLYQAFAFSIPLILPYLLLCYHRLVHADTLTMTSLISLIVLFFFCLYYVFDLVHLWDLWFMDTVDHAMR